MTSNYLSLIIFLLLIFSCSPIKEEQVENEGAEFKSSVPPCALSQTAESDSGEVDFSLEQNQSGCTLGDEEGFSY